MKQLIPLIKVSLNHDMNLFKINTKKQSTFSKVLLPLLLAFYLMFLLGMYANMMMDVLKPIHLEYVVLTLFSLAVVLMTLIEGIYKSGSLLFNCKDDQLLFSLPIKKRTVLFIRVFKFYMFEFLYNSLFLLPAIAVYAYYIHPGWLYYLVSIVALFILPIVPVVLSCIIGFIITSLSSMFKGKNIIQTIITFVFILVIFYISYGLDDFIKNLAKKANSLNDMITKLYYPVGAYISLVNKFDFKTFLIYMFSHLLIIAIMLFVLSKVYFKINSNFKKVLTSHKNGNYVVKTNNRLVAFIKKEFNRFVSTPVFIINAGFGLILFIVICIFISIRFDSTIATISKTIPGITKDMINGQLPVYMFGLVCFSALMTSITSSMISLESKSFNILKSLPVKSYMIVFYKVITALVIMIPCILLGDLIIFIRFKFDILSIILILIASFVLSFVSELIGILVNLKYPKLDATNDTEIVKQSMSSMVSVFIGMGLVGATIIVITKMLTIGLKGWLIMLILDGIYSLIGIVLVILLIKTCDRSFNNINL